ncbi:hypothetical protein ACJJTC_015600 [Scirpophaga incertulas]
MFYAKWSQCTVTECSSLAVTAVTIVDDVTSPRLQLAGAMITLVYSTHKCGCRGHTLYRSPPRSKFSFSKPHSLISNGFRGTITPELIAAQFTLANGCRNGHFVYWPGTSPA